MFLCIETIKNPKVLLEKLKKEKSEIKELIEKGEVEKADKLKQEKAWKKAFDKTDGKKVSYRQQLSHKMMQFRALR